AHLGVDEAGKNAADDNAPFAWLKIAELAADHVLIHHRHHALRFGKNALDLHQLAVAIETGHAKAANVGTGGDHARLGFHLRSETLPIINGRRGAHEAVGHHAEDAALQLTIKTVEHREHDDERHDAERHAQQGKGGYEGYELVA